MQIILNYKGPVRTEEMMDWGNSIGKENLMGLNDGERFIIWSIRRIVTERGPDGRLLDECFDALKADGETGLRVLSVFLGKLGRAARRSIEVGTPEHLFTTWDERRILTLLAAAQVAAAQEDLAQAEGAAAHSAVFEAHLRWIASLEHRAELARAALALGRLLAAHGHGLVLDFSPPPPDGFRLRLVAPDSKGGSAGGPGDAGVWAVGA